MAGRSRTGGSFSCSIKPGSAGPRGRMPKLSAFTPVGLLKMSSRPSRARVIYESMRAALGDQFRTEQGDHVEASLFARAMGIARAQRLLEHAGDQALPRRVAELL